jgi:hypothetical protein
MYTLKSNNSIKAQCSIAPNTALSVVVTYNDTGVINVVKGVTTEPKTLGNSLVDIVGSPVERIDRYVSQISIVNTDNQTQTVTIYFTNSGTDYKVFIAELLVNEKVEFVKDDGWQVYDATGLKKKVASGSVSITEFSTVVPYSSYSYKVNIIDPLVTPTSKVLPIWGSFLETDENCPDNNIMFWAVALDGSFDLYMETEQRPMGGAYKFQYLIG